MSTPIGNLGDFSPRARETLASADVVYCEDTRRTRELLAHAGVRGQRLVSLHGHNEQSRAAALIERVASGETVAVVSDAGTPAVSDPGARLVARAADAGVRVSAVPGPSAAMAALVVSGMPTDRFCFEGFLPRRGALRRKRLEGVAAEERTAVLYEAPPRLAGTLADLAAACGGERTVVVARELTKLHEEIWRGRLDEAAHEFAQRTVRGEVVLVLGGSSPPAGARDEEVAAAIERRLVAGDSARDAATAVSRELGVPRRRAYETAVSLRNAGGPRAVSREGAPPAVSGRGDEA